MRKFAIVLLLGLTFILPHSSAVAREWQVAPFPRYYVVDRFCRDGAEVRFAYFTNNKEETIANPTITFDVEVNTIAIGQRIFTMNHYPNTPLNADVDDNGVFEPDPNSRFADQTFYYYGWGVIRWDEQDIGTSAVIQTPEPNFSSTFGTIENCYLNLQFLPLIKR